MIWRRVNGLAKDQSGIALVIALVLMVVLTLIGLASTLSSTFEIKHSGNKRGSTDAFFAADGGAQAVMGTVANFNKSNFVAITTDALPADLRDESVDKKFSSPSLTLPTGVSFTDPPTATVFHTTKSNAPRGLGFGATGNIDYEHFFVDSVGRDQTDTGLLKSNCQVREKVVRLLPTLQGGY